MLIGIVSARESIYATLSHDPVALKEICNVFGSVFITSTDESSTDAPLRLPRDSIYSIKPTTSPPETK
jgi:hypothetical protein